MKKLAKEEEWELLDECLEKGNCDELFRQYWNLVYFIVKNVLSKKTSESFSVEYSEQDLEDVCQEVFEYLFKEECKGLRKYDKQKGGKVSGWIRRATVWITLKFHRRESPKRSNLYFLEEIKSVIKEEFRVNDRIEAKVPQKCIEKLTDQQRAVLELEFKEGLSPSEIADRMGKKLGNIYTIRSRAIKRLKECVDELENDDS